MKQYVKMLARKIPEGFEYVNKKISETKLNQGVFLGPQIMEYLKEHNFIKIMDVIELKTWESGKWICENLLGNKKV